jgi:hypothetical protein
MSIKKTTNREPSPRLAKLANAKHRLLMGRFQVDTQLAIEIGKLLLQAKKDCEPGTWMAWKEKHLHFSEYWVQVYMKLARNEAKIKADWTRFSDVTCREVLQLLGQLPPNAHLPDAPEQATPAKAAIITPPPETPRAAKDRLISGPAPAPQAAQSAPLWTNARASRRPTKSSRRASRRARAAAPSTRKWPP